MKDESLTPKLTIPLYEKIYSTEVLKNRAENLIAVGLRTSVVIVQLTFDENNGAIGFEIIHKVNLGTRAQCLAWSPITNVVCSPRLLSYAAGGADYDIRLITSDLALNPRENVLTLKGHKDYVNTLAFNPEDGSQIVSGSDDHTVMLWDTSKGTTLYTVTFRSAVMSVSWHPDEVSKLMIAEKTGVIHIFNIVSYHPIMSLDCGNGPLSSADWCLSNSQLIAVAVRSDISVWDISKMAPVSKTFLRQDIVRHVKMAPFSDAVIASTGLPNYNVRISNTKNSHTFQVMSNLPVGGISWHPKKPLLIVGHDEKLSIFYISPNKIQT